MTPRRRHLLVVLAWLVAAAAGAFGHARLPDVTVGGQTSFLPAHSQSTQAAAALSHGFAGGEDLPALVVFERPGGLTRTDRVAIARIAHQAQALGLRGATPVLAPFTVAGHADLLGRKGLVSRDRQAALIPVGLNPDVRGAVTQGVDRLRALIRRQAPPGLQAHVTGPAGVAVDLEGAADSAGRTLLLVTAGLVLLLLLAVYRAPLLALLPLAVVGAAYLVAAGLTYLLIRAGALAVNAEGTMLLLVLIFGAGTDYSLLLVHRYRAELATGAPPEEALREARRRSAPAIGAAGATVMAAMLVLLLADLRSTHSLGPVLALGVGVMLLAAFTLLPAALALLGPRAFWPAKRLHEPRPAGIWQKVSGLVERRARPVAAVVTAALAVAALGNLLHTQPIGFGQGVADATDSSRGTAILNRHFSPGLNSPLTVLVDVRAADAALAALHRVPGVAAALPAGVSPAHREAMLGVILRVDPYSTAAIDVVKTMRAALARIAPGAAVGGITAENLDVERANARDTRVILPAVLLLVLAILAVLLRALAAPAYLIAAAVASFASTLGVVTVLFTKVLGQSGITFDLVLMAFIFLVALGVDYTIFLMHRTREEARVHGTREGVLRALVATGPVVTGAGVVLAGTFATLTLIPLDALVQIGATVALGVLVDTFVVRALLVPSVTRVLSERAWWPRRGRG